MCPVTIVVSAASHAAAWASGPVTYTDPGRPAAAARAVLQPASSPEAAGWPRSSARSTCTVSCAGWLSGPGSIPDSISRRQASVSASCWRWATVRVSSVPLLAPSAASTAATAAAAGPVRSPESRPAPPIVVSSHTARSPKVSLSRSGAVRDRSIICCARAPRSASPAPPPAAASKIASASARRCFGQLISPLADHLRPRAAQLPGRERGGDQRMGGQPPGPLHRRTGGAVADAGDGPQPRRRPVLPIGLMALLGAERGQQPRPRRRVLRLGLLQPDQRLGLRGRPQLSRITGGQVTQPGPHHRQRLHRARRRSRLTQRAHGPDHLPRDGSTGGPGTPGL